MRRYTWVVNFTGARDGFVAVDMAQEHNIKDIKVSYARSRGAVTLTLKLLWGRSPGGRSDLEPHFHISNECPQLFLCCVRSRRHLQRSSQLSEDGVKYTGPP